MEPRSGFSIRIASIAAALAATCGFVAFVAARDAGAVRALVQDGRFARAEAAARAELVALERCAPERIELECLCAEAARRGDKKLAQETLDLALGSVALAADAFGADDLRAADPLLQLGALRCVRREWTEAKASLERALALLRDASAGNDPRQATALAYLAIEAL